MCYCVWYCGYLYKWYFIIYIFYWYIPEYITYIYIYYIYIYILHIYITYLYIYYIFIYILHIYIIICIYYITNNHLGVYLVCLMGQMMINRWMTFVFDDFQVSIPPRQNDCHYVVEIDSFTTSVFTKDSFSFLWYLGSWLQPCFAFTGPTEAAWCLDFFGTPSWDLLWWSFGPLMYLHQAGSAFDADKNEVIIIADTWELKRIRWWFMAKWSAISFQGEL